MTAMPLSLSYLRRVAESYDITQYNAMRSRFTWIKLGVSLKLNFTNLKTNALESIVSIEWKIFLNKFLANFLVVGGDFVNRHHDITDIFATVLFLFRFNYFNTHVTYLSTFQAKMTELLGTRSIFTFFLFL